MLTRYELEPGDIDSLHIGNHGVLPSGVHLMIRLSAGSFLPEKTLLPPEAGTSSYLVHLAPREYSYFVDAPVTDLLTFAGSVTGMAADAQIIEDHYYDTDDHLLLHHGGSLRLREYLNPHRDVRFDIVCVAWSVLAMEATETLASHERVDCVVVETFQKNTVSDFEQLVEYYEGLGLVETYKLRKARHRFKIVPGTVQDVSAEGHPQFSHLAGVFSTYKDVTDIGLRVFVDELERPLRGHSTIVEIEFGAGYVTEASAISVALKDKFAPVLVEKSFSKIRYVVDSLIN